MATTGQKEAEVHARKGSSGCYCGVARPWVIPCETRSKINSGARTCLGDRVGRNVGKLNLLRVVDVVPERTQRLLRVSVCPDDRPFVVYKLLDVPNIRDPTSAVSPELKIKMDLPQRLDLSATSYVLQGRVPAHVCPDFSALMQLKPEQAGTVIIYGKPVKTPRFTAHYLRPYHYTGMMHPAEPLPDILKPLLKWTNESLSGSTAFNQALVNFYVTGNDYIGKHSDDERQLVPGSAVFSASFGQSRLFRIRDKATGMILKDIVMEDGTYLLMGGDMQKEYTHEVPKVAGEKGKRLGARINVTFRSFR